MRCVSVFLRNDRGTAAAEMALLTPMLLILMFGSMELGNYFYNEHKVVKSVRDAARYVARLPFTNFSCGSSSIADSTLEAQVKNLVRTGQLTGGTPLVSGWADTKDIDVKVSCNSSFGNGIYKGITGGAPIVKVSVSALKYPSLSEAVGFNAQKILGFDSKLFTINASSTAAVMGA